MRMLLSCVFWESWNSSTMMSFNFLSVNFLMTDFVVFSGKMGKLLLSVFWESWNSNTTMNFTLPSVWFLNDWLIDFSLFLLITSKLLTYYYGKVKNRKWKRSEQMIQGLNGFKKKAQSVSSRMLHSLKELFDIILWNRGRNDCCIRCHSELYLIEIVVCQQAFIVSLSA